MAIRSKTAAYVATLKLICVAYGTFGYSAPIQAQTSSEAASRFAGPYVGVGLARQNIFAGALVAGQDIIGQDNQLVAELVAGWRWQPWQRLVLGVEVQYGRFGDSLMRRLPEFNNLQIRYDGSDQIGYGVQLGYVVAQRKEILLYGFAFETERDFRVTLTNDFGQFSQRDEQGSVRWGIGAEMPLGSSAWHVRATLARTSVDFSAPADRGVEDELDVGVSVLRRF